jgi:hypothetical protein
MIDPFGVPQTQYQMLHNLGFRNLVINRIPFDQKNERKEKKRLTFWARDKLQNSGTKVSDPLLVHIMHGHYNSDETILPDSKWIELNPMHESFREVRQTVSRILQHLEKVSKSQSSNLVMFPYGDDFAHRQFGETMARMEGLISLIKSNPT